MIFLLNLILQNRDNLLTHPQKVTLSVEERGKGERSLKMSGEEFSLANLYVPSCLMSLVPVRTGVKIVALS